MQVAKGAVLIFGYGKVMVYHEFLGPLTGQASQYRALILSKDTLWEILNISDGITVKIPLPKFCITGNVPLECYLFLLWLKCGKIKGTGHFSKTSKTLLFEIYSENIYFDRHIFSWDCWSSVQIFETRSLHQFQNSVTSSLLAPIFTWNRH